MTAPQTGRIFYYAGPGDVAQTFEMWRDGVDDPNEVSITYSSQFFDCVRARGLEARVISSHQRETTVAGHEIQVEHHPHPVGYRGALAYHTTNLAYYARIARLAKRYQPDVAVLSTGFPWFLARGLVRAGIRVIPSLHCSLWPQGFPPRAPHQRLFLHWSRKLWSSGADSILCVSPECERQVRALAPNTAAHFEQARVQYRLGYLDRIGDPPEGDRFRLFFAGRLEADKGVFELLEVAERLEREQPGRFAWELAGAGGARDALAREIQRAGLDASFQLVGKLDRHGMRDAYERCHAVVVPTNRDFAEGLNRVSVEGVLAGRPVITSRLSNAIDVLGAAVVEVPPEQVEAYGDAILALAADPVRYGERRDRCAEVSDQFYDRSRAWGAGLDRALARVYGTEPRLLLPA